MSDPPMAERALAIIRHEARAGALANAAINGLLSAWLLRGKGPHLLTADSIAAKSHTVLGSAVVMALLLGVIAGSLAFRSFRKKARVLGLAGPGLLDRPYWPFGALQALGAAVTMAAYVVLGAVLWQRWAGSVTVATAVAASLTGILAGATAWFVTMRTTRALINPI